MLLLTVFSAWLYACSADTPLLIMLAMTNSGSCDHGLVACRQRCRHQETGRDLSYLFCVSGSRCISGALQSFRVACTVTAVLQRICVSWIALDEFDVVIERLFRR